MGFVSRSDVHTPFWAQLADAFQVGQSLVKRSQILPWHDAWLPNQAYDPASGGIS